MYQKGHWDTSTQAILTYLPGSFINISFRGCTCVPVEGDVLLTSKARAGMYSALAFRDSSLEPPAPTLVLRKIAHDMNPLDAVRDPGRDDTVRHLQP